MAVEQDISPVQWKFADLTADPRVRERWERVRRYFFLRESTYDMTCRCNIRCEGCYYFEGDKQHVTESCDPRAWRALMQAEKARGITFVVLAGAEPSLVPELLSVCHAELPLGAIATNGLRRISEDIGYRIHISVWGNDDTSLRIRKAKDMLRRQIADPVTFADAVHHGRFNSEVLLIEIYKEKRDVVRLIDSKTP